MKPEFYLHPKAANEPDSFTFPLTAELDAEHVGMQFREFAEQLAKQYETAYLRDSEQRIIGIRLISMDFCFILGKRTDGYGKETESKART